MKAQGKGILPGSTVYFHNASETAARLYFYPLCVGRFVCDAQYAVQRDSYDSFLLLHVLRGKGLAQAGDCKLELQAGDLLLLDCYAPHFYGTATGWEILWVHFDGTQARAYFDLICQGAPAAALTPQDPRAARKELERLVELYHQKSPSCEAFANLRILGLLTQFMARPLAESAPRGLISEELLAYITDHLASPLTLDDMARQAALSPFYFTRQFKKETGYTPHEYLITARVNAAKFYLKTTALPIKEITYQCGFSSEATFCTTFKRITSLAPSAYRQSSGKTE